MIRVCARRPFAICTMGGAHRCAYGLGLYLRIGGDVKARADAPQPGNAPWLLVSTRSTGGDGRLASITSLQRVNTVGGVAPARICDGKSLGTREQVPFSTEYIYFSK